ncbi:hypothetical protein PTSG_04595 [Salpingoeca rosetta]|uniref:Uncharacterized protein n=1 Tax=Salpingoeca rosetta (strain ATCC 50818 / BSB-021) TaxID=946362 RepID=F2U7W1_SALR5|nr:uncharacterized protein PTSG_04595 [Salpingoeca rosetta]EGD72866.1 hypothetical protein PTSG_04595 [Salpingoeca rosetta]|eukprot:XP_004994689.1 hypothetical protein PTSG_04595 [Salpingoeca rosetta]
MSTLGMNANASTIQAATTATQPAIARASKPSSRHNSTNTIIAHNVSATNSKPCINNNSGNNDNNMADKPTSPTSCHQFAKSEPNTRATAMPPLAEKERVTVAMRQAFDALECNDVTDEHIDRLATIICSAMGTPNRVYHATRHVFDLFVSAETQPISCLAGVFHDVVYLQIDDGVHPLVMGELSRAGVTTSGAERGPSGEDRPMYTLATDQQPLPLRLCRAIFGWEDATLLKTGQQGVNEFLSALLAAQCLQALVSSAALFEIVICIEATIPFRGPCVYNDLLERALAATDIVPGLSDTYTRHQAKLAVEVACLVAERDVGNFASTDTRWFLTNSWKLLPEIHRSLRDAAAFTFADYAKAMLANVRFYLFLQSDPSRVFHQFESCRTREEYQRLLSLTTRNLNIGMEYGRTKLIAACILDALARQQGLAHRPASWFMQQPGCGVDMLGCGRQRVVWSARKRQSSGSSSSPAARRPSLSLCTPKGTAAPRTRASVHAIAMSSLAERTTTTTTTTSSASRSSDPSRRSSHQVHHQHHQHRRSCNPAINPAMKHSTTTTAASRLSATAPGHFANGVAMHAGNPRGSYTLAPFTLATSAPRTPRGSACVGSSFTEVGRRKSSLPSPAAMRRRSMLPPVDDHFFTNLLVPSYDYVEVLLELGTGYEAEFDVDADMTSLYVHQALVTEEGVHEAADMCAEYLEGKIDPATFLDAFERRVTTLLAHCMQLHTHRNTPTTATANGDSSSSNNDNNNTTTTSKNITTSTTTSISTSKGGHALSTTASSPPSSPVPKRPATSAAKGDVALEQSDA